MQSHYLINGNLYASRYKKAFLPCKENTVAIASLPRPFLAINQRGLHSSSSTSNGSSATPRHRQEPLSSQPVGSFPSRSTQSGGGGSSTARDDSAEHASANEADSTLESRRPTSSDRQKPNTTVNNTNKKKQKNITITSITVLHATPPNEAILTVGQHQFLREADRVRPTQASA